MYNSIYNDPHERQTKLYSNVYWENFMTDDEIKSVVEYCESLEKTTATTQGEQDEEKVKEVRSSKVAWLRRDDANYQIFDKFNTIIQVVNDRFYNFNLNGYEMIQYTTYNENDKGEYKWHMDASVQEPIVDNGMHRKLSMTFLLNDDFEGGEFQLNTGRQEFPETVPCRKGRAIFFPSFMLHRVTPVTKGTRRSLVIWVIGPKFV